MDLNILLESVYNTYLAKLIAAIVILLIGVFVGRFCGNLLRKVLNELNTDKILKEEAGVKIPVEEFFANALKYLIFFAAIIMALRKAIGDKDKLKVKLVDYSVEVATGGVDATVKVSMTLKDKYDNKVVVTASSPDMILASVDVFEKGYNVLLGKNKRKN